MDIKDVSELKQVEAPAIVVGPPVDDLQRTDKSKSPTTTKSEDLTSLGQRRINLIWESQQALIASGVVGTLLYVSAIVTLLIIKDNATEQQIAMSTTAFMLLSNLGSLVIGFYFGRTNHQKIGGVGDKVGSR